jgi:hypothetical protein
MGPFAPPHEAGIAQLVEQLICNQQVIGSNPIAGSGCEAALVKDPQAATNRRISENRSLLCLFFASHSVALSPVLHPSRPSRSPFPGVLLFDPSAPIHIALRINGPTTRAEHTVTLAPGNGALPAATERAPQLIRLHAHSAVLLR